MGKQLRIALALASFCCVHLFAQGTTSRVTGTVTDPSGSAVSGANVTLTNERTGAAFHTTSSNQGTYVFEAVQTGS
jgi:hypothetical protein